MKAPLVALLVLLAATEACSDPREPEAESPRGVILISVDTLRADRLSCYGSALSTPAIDQLANDGVLFSDAITPVPITLPAHTSLLTGTFPIFHGVRDNSGFIVPASQETLAEILSAQGFRTGAFVGSFILDSRFGLDQGFEQYVDGFEVGTFGEATTEISEHTASTVLASARSWLSQNREQTFFLFIHLFDPHAPYQAPAEFQAPGRHPYDAEVLYVDRELGRFLEYLRGEDLYESSLIVFTSDHGEGLGEHGEDTHGLFLYDTTLRVPLIFKLPGDSPRGIRIDRQVRLVDVMPAILQVLRIQSPAGVQGRGLMAAWSGGDMGELPAFSETQLPFLNYGWSPLHSYRHSGRKLIDAPRPEFFDLKNDPQERTNLLSTQSALAGRFRQEKAEFIARYRGTGLAQAQRSVDAETSERLRSLGYVAVSSARTPGEEISSGLEDPKDKISLFNRIWRAQAALSEERVEESIKLLAEVIREDQSIFMAHSIQALNFLRLSEPAKALPHLRRAAELRPDDMGSRFYLGMAFFQLGRLREAEIELKQALELDPGNDAASNNLAAVYVRQNRYREAASIFSDLLRNDPSDVAAWVNLGVARLSSRELDAASEAFSRAFELNPSIPEVHNNLGLISMERGDLDTAISSFQRALELNPNYANAHYNLGRAYQQKGLIQEAQREFDAAKRTTEPQRH